MKRTVIIVLACIAILATGSLFNAVSQETRGASKEMGGNPAFEYASVRFTEEKTSIVWPDGSVKNVMALNGKQKFDNGTEKYPKGADYRMYWLTVAMNIMGRRGFDFVYMNGPDIVMKRQVAR